MRGRSARCGTPLRASVLRSGAEMLAVGLAAAAVAYGIGALAATLT